MVNLKAINQPPQKVCSIDASTNSIAFAIFNGKDLELFGKISFSGTNTYSKVGDAARKCLSLFKQFDIDSIVIEHTVFINSPKTAADLALVQGAVLGSAQINGIRVAGSVNPITWQSFIGNTKLSAVEKQQLRKENLNKLKLVKFKTRVFVGAKSLDEFNLRMSIQKVCNNNMQSNKKVDFLSHQLSSR
jgi:Holliday junction resolvasome RuvABC endonuclease subunit